MKRVFTVLLAMFILTGISAAQGISIGATGGLTMVQGPDEFTNDIGDGGFGYSSEVHFGLKGKFSLPLIPISITGQIIYSNFTGEGEGQNEIGQLVDAEVSLPVLIFGAGAEYNFVPGPISPYLAFDLFYTRFGEQEIKSVISGGSSETETGDVGNRSGIGVGAGLNFGLVPMVDIDISAKYNVYNLIGKEEGEKTISAINISATVYLGF